MYLKALTITLAITTASLLYLMVVEVGAAELGCPCAPACHPPAEAAANAAVTDTVVHLHVSVLSAQPLHQEVQPRRVP